MVLKWMVGFNLILTVAIVGMLFFVLANELAANAAATTDAFLPPPECSRNASPEPWEGHWCDLAVRSDLRLSARF
jgi:hypothetical protein